MQAVNPWTCNEMSNMPKVATSKNIYLHSQKMLEREEMFRPEKIPRLWMVDIIDKLTKPGDFVKGLCTGLFSVEMSCMDLHKNSLFVGSEKDDNCWENSTTPFVELFFSKCMNSIQILTGRIMAGLLHENYLENLMEFRSNETLKFGIFLMEIPWFRILLYSAAPNFTVLREPKIYNNKPQYCLIRGTFHESSFLMNTKNMRFMQRKPVLWDWQFSHQLFNTKWLV